MRCLLMRNNCHHGRKWGYDESIRIYPVLETALYSNGIRVVFMRSAPFLRWKWAGRNTITLPCWCGKRRSPGLTAIYHLLICLVPGRNQVDLPTEKGSVITIVNLSQSAAGVSYRE
jgi:hypothetical protein